MTSGTWALENVIALQAAGLPAVVLAPTPWIPRPLAVSEELRNWSQVPDYLDVRGVPVYYPRCPHYPRNWIHDSIYPRLPFLDTQFLWPWCKATIDRIMDENPFDVVHANFMFPAGYLGTRIKRRYGVPLVVHERSIQRMQLAGEFASRRRAYCEILKQSDMVLTDNSAMAASVRQMQPEIADQDVVLQPGANPDQLDKLRRDRPPEFDLSGHCQNARATRF